MKPLLIFQLPKDANFEETKFLCDTIEEGLKTGSLILDSRVCVLSFDKNGDMNYCTPKYAVNAD